MKANELRIGNYLFDTETDKVVKFVCLDPDGPLYRIYIAFMESKDDEWDRGWPIVDIEPIPLTVEWFEKFGFQKISNYYRIFPDIGIYVLNIKPVYNVWSAFINEQFIRRDIKYVHQLQNLYFNLTGEELAVVESTSSLQTNRD